MTTRARGLCIASEIERRAASGELSRCRRYSPCSREIDDRIGTPLFLRLLVVDGRDRMQSGGFRGSPRGGRIDR